MTACFAYAHIRAMLIYSVMNSFSVKNTPKALKLVVIDFDRRSFLVLKFYTIKHEEKLACKTRHLLESIEQINFGIHVPNNI